MTRKGNFRESPEKFGPGHGLVEERVKVFISLHFKKSLPLLYLINMILLPYD